MHSEWRAAAQEKDRWKTSSHNTDMPACPRMCDGCCACELIELASSIRKLRYTINETSGPGFESDTHSP